MKFFMSILFAAVLLVGCERIEGQLNITKDLKLKNSKGDTHLLRVGTYSADIKPNSSKKFTLRLNNDSDEKFEFDHNGNIPDNGPFEISSKVSGQSVDLSGDVRTIKTNSPVQESMQSCTYQQPVEYCRPAPNGRTSCTIIYRRVNGTEWVRFYDKITNQNVNLSVKAVAEAEESADFHGDLSYAERIVVGRTSCR